MQIDHYTLAAQYHAQSDELFNQAYQIVKDGSPTLSQLEHAAIYVSKSIEKISMAIHLYENIVDREISDLMHINIHKCSRLQGIIAYNIELARDISLSFENEAILLEESHGF